MNDPNRDRSAVPDVRDLDESPYLAAIDRFQHELPAYPRHHADLAVRG